MENNTLDYTQSGGSKRPTFLTVLCILTWVGCALSIWSPIKSITSGGGEKELAEARAKMSELSSADNEFARSMSQSMEGMLDEAEKAAKYASLMGWVSLICVIACAFGAWQMWNLKKTGFYIYTAGELIPVILTMVLMGGMASVGGMMGGIMAGLGIIMALIPVAFVVMYGLNLKHMQ